MAPRNQPATKANLIKAKQDLSFAAMGHELLDQKRNILVVELLRLVDQAVECQDLMDAHLQQAHTGFRNAVVAMGRVPVLHVTSTINVSAEITLSDRRVMGVRLPVVATAITDNGPYYSPDNTSAWIDVAHRRFREALELLGRLAELKVSIMRLAAEVRKTMRKVNALDKIAIPDLQQTVALMSERLEESDRDMTILMKRVKSRLDAKEQRS